MSQNKTQLKKESKWKANIIKDGDFEILTRWEKSKSRKKWERAITISNAHAGVAATEIAKKINRHQDTIAKWLRNYDRKGMESFQKKRKPNEFIQQTIIEKKQNLIKLIHETPQLHGINRTVWGIQSLSDAYRNQYGTNLSKTTVSVYLKDEGYSFKKAREVLTSPDPLFREKLDKIKSILSNLKPNEKFFSVDEFGPFAVKMKGGRSLTKGNEIKSYPQIQRSKGCFLS